MMIPDDTITVEEPNDTRDTIAIALPGLGKTTLCQTVAGFGDADFGRWCRQRQLQPLRMDSATKRYYAKSFTKEVILPMLDDGLLPLTNEPAVFQYIPTDVAVVTVVPNHDFEHTWFANLVMRTLETEPEQVLERGSDLEIIVREARQWPESPAWKISGVPHLHVRSYGHFRDLMEALL